MSERWYILPEEGAVAEYERDEANEEPVLYFVHPNKVNRHVADAALRKLSRRTRRGV